MSLSEDLYQRFLTGHCTAAEEAEVLAWLRRHPRAWEKHLQHKGFESFRADARLHPAVSANMLQAIHSGIRTQQQRSMQRRRIMAVAAALLAGIVCAGGWWQWGRYHNGTPKAALAAASIMDTLRNETNHTVQLQLADGSQVQLYKYSQLVMQKGFTANARAVYLSGGARFAVAKDQGRPFTVYASTLATTALGTVFTVQHRNGQAVHIKLISGKIVVKSTTSDAAFAPVYLQPGETLAWNKDMPQPLKRLEAALPAVPAGEEHLLVDEQTLAFNHVPLAKVLEVLGTQYQADIQYDNKQFKKVYVTATFSRQDSLINILQTIATLNNANVENAAGNHYQLIK